MKSVFVTVGTTKFDDLIEQVDSPKFFNILKKHGYNKLIIQTGNYSGTIENSIPLPTTTDNNKTTNTNNTQFQSYYFDYRPSLLEYMKNADLIISHAGSGSILESLENNKPCICVVNDKLMDNHQTELAEKLSTPITDKSASSSTSSSSYILSTNPKQLCETIEDKLDNYIKSRILLDPKIHAGSQKLFSNTLTSQFNNNNSTSKPLKTMVVLGSGGHTTEMFYLLKDVNKQKFNPFIYVLADSDKRSEDKIKIEHPSVTPDQIMKIPRSRNVGQSFFYSIFTTLIALFYSIMLIFKTKPDCIICNGPGTCVPLVVSVLILRWLRIKKDSKIIYIESLARVNGLSLSGKLLVHISDWIVIQWPELMKHVDSKNVSCINLFFKTF